MKPLLVTLALVLAVACRADLTGARAEGDWGAVYLPQWGVTLRVPGGWQLDAPRAGDSARLYSPQGTEVLVRAWEGATVLTPAEAAAEYELSLGLGEAEAAPPVAFQTDAGLAGVWVELAPLGDHPLLALVAFSVEKRRIALAVRGLPDFVEAGRKRLEAMAASLLLPGQSGATPAPPKAPLVGAVVPATPGGPPSGALAAPLPPAVPPAPPAPPPPQTLGAFTVSVPAGYAAQAVGADGSLRVESPAGAGFFLYPLRTAPDASADEAFAAWSAPLGDKFALHGQRRDRNTVVYMLTLPGPEARRVLVYAWQQGDTALVLGLSARPELWKNAPALARALAATTCAGWRAAAPALPATPRPWVEGEVSLQLPQNWTAHGGVRIYQKAPVVDLTLAGDDVTLTWRQPYTPTFRDLTPILQATGQQEGDPYREGEEEDPLLILARRAPDKFVEWLLQQPAEGLGDARVTRVEPSPEAAALLPGPEREGAVVWVSGTHGGQARERVYLCATAPLPLEQGAFRWRAAVLAADYLPGHAREALAALRAILAAAGPLRPESEAGQAVTAATQTAIAAAGAVVLPPEGHGPWPLLGADFVPATAGQTPQWTAAPALAAWRELVGKGEVGLPELAEGAWGN
jgi:hypothetical protein